MNFEAAYQNKNFKVGEANWAILGVFISFWRLGTFDAVSVPDRSFHERKIITNRPATMDRCDKSAIFFYLTGDTISNTAGKNSGIAITQVLAS